MPEDSRDTSVTPEQSWRNDRIVEIVHGAEAPYRHESAGFRPEDDQLYLRLHFVAVYVSDQERSLRFYHDQLGFALVTDVKFASGNRWIEVAPPDGTAILALVKPIPGANEDHFVGNSGLTTFLTVDVEAKYREWSARGVKFPLPPQTPAWGGKFCRFVDPDGNSFGLAGFDAVTQELERRRRAYAEKLEAERRAAQEMEIARQVQARLFPQCLPTIPTLDYAGLCQQARVVGGDYYDFLDLGSERLALVVGDIAGKGIAASLLMANLQANLRSQSAIAADQPQKFLSSVNRLLHKNTEENAYATLFFADFDHRSGRLLYANCGHLPGLILRADGDLDRLEATCTVLGLFPDLQCALAETRLGSGDLLALYSDGVTESFNGAEEEFGEDRVIEALRRNPALPARAKAQAIVEEVLAFSGREQFDDITLILARRTGASEAAFSKCS